MPSVSTGVVNYRRLYEFLGVPLLGVGEQLTGDCPWCKRAGKFSVNAQTGLWRCWVCGEGTDKGGGNASQFLELLHDASDEQTEDYSELMASRRLLYPETLMAWGICRSRLTGDWVVPGYTADGCLKQLYHYVRHGQGRRLLPVPGLGHALHGAPGLPGKGCRTVYLCEGPWDGLALWETLRIAKSVDDGKLVLTANPDRSLLSRAAVLAVPGCTTFFESWLPLFAGMDVVLLYDNDYPRERAGSAGYEGMRRVARILSAAPEPPTVVRYLCWGQDGYDPALPNGYDVRDHLTKSRAPADRVAALGTLLAKVRDVPQDWLVDVPRVRSGRHSVAMECAPCSRWKDVINAWRKALKWTDGLDHALAVMLASVASTKAVGDQLWVKVIGPAACGKSTLCEALSVNAQYVLAKSTIRGFHSGYRQEGEQGKEVDNSLIPLVKDKTLVTKDGDTLLQSPNLPQILAEARDLYDSTARTHYRNAMSKDYAGIRMTWLLCGTSSLRALDQSELGERFLDCVIMEGIDEDLEDEILWRKANQADRNMAAESNGQAISQYEPELAEAMQLTGGYVGHLRKHAAAKLAQVQMDDAAKRRCTRLGKFTAFMRARPSVRQEEHAEREFATRLVSQLVRLAKCLAFVLNETTVSSAVMQRVSRVALDTSRGLSMAIAAHLYHSGQAGLPVQTLAMHTNRTEEKTRVLLRFLKAIGVAESFQSDVKGLAGKTRWRLTERFHRLYAEVISD